MLSYTGTADELNLYLELRRKGGSEYSRVFHKMANMEFGELPSKYFKPIKDGKIRSPAWILKALNAIGATQRTSFHMFRPNCDKNCMCLSINAAIINGALNRNKHPSSKFHAAPVQHAEDACPVSVAKPMMQGALASRLLGEMVLVRNDGRVKRR